MLLPLQEHMAALNFCVEPLDYPEIIVVLPLKGCAILKATIYFRRAELFAARFLLVSLVG